MSRQLTSLCLALIFVCFVCFVGRSYSQSATATLSGTITDPQGAVIPGVLIKIQNDATSQERTATTNSEGQFTVPLLPPGKYTITAKRDGFASVQVPNVVLNIGDQKALNLALKVGDANATVEVRPDEGIVRTDASVATVVDRQFVGNIPLNGRSLQPLITLVPGVVLVPSSAGGTTKGQFAINGQRANSNYFTVDGVSANVANNAGAGASQAPSGGLPGLTADGGTNSLVSVDALQEFKIKTSTYSAEYGRGPGGQISFATRSGTNDFHGTVFDYIRNEAFDANDWFANRSGTPRPPERQHDFGGTLGGPVLFPRFGEGGPRWYSGRNKTFFFFSYEGLRLRLPKFGQTFVPTLQLRQSVPEAVKPFLNAFPIPNGQEIFDSTGAPTGLAGFNHSYSDRSVLNATSIRIDQTIGQKLAIFGRVNKAPSETEPHATLNLAAVNSILQDMLTVTLGANYAQNATAANEFRFNYTNNAGINDPHLNSDFGATPVPRSLLIPAQYDSETAQGGFTLNFGGKVAQIAIGGVRSSQRQINLVENYSYTLAGHQLKFGLDYRRLTPYIQNRTYIISLFFSTPTQLLSATPSSETLSREPFYTPVFTNFSAFAQDDWKLSRRLTLSLGVRWEVNPPPTTVEGIRPFNVLGLDNLATAYLAPAGTPLWKTTYDNFAPRLGASYQLSQKPGAETVIRGGFGVFYDAGNSLGHRAFNGYPYNPGIALSPSVPLPVDPVRFAPPKIDTTTLPYGSLEAFDPNLKLPYTLEWNLAIERSLGRSQTFTASYVGAAGRRLLDRKTFKNLTAINPKFTQIALTSNASTSDYESMQLQYQRRLSRGLQALASYTWAHSIDESSDDFADTFLRRGNSDFDIRHNFTAAITYALPMPRTNRFVDSLFRGWSLDSRVNIQSAFPINISAGQVVDTIDMTVKEIGANVIPGVPFYVDDPTKPGGRILNNKAYTAADNAMLLSVGCKKVVRDVGDPPTVPTGPAKGAWCTPANGVGNFGRNVVRGLPTWQVDMALLRQLRLTEKVALQLRAEAFNIFNHPNFGTIDTSLTSASGTFGQATNMLGRQLSGQNALYQVGGPRSMQFAAKVVF